jgi:D-glycero-alpha-D-manno-heptose-7-phosphate kinase
MFNSILTFWTGVTRSSAMILKEQEEKNNTKKNIKTLIEMRNQVDELKNMLDNDGFSIEKFGAIIHRGWEMKKGLASKVTNPEIDDYYSTACQYGAKGGKISGAGAGGFISFIADKKNQSTISSELVKKGLIPYKFNLASSGTMVYEI